MNTQETEIRIENPEEDKAARFHLERARELVEFCLHNASELVDDIGMDVKTAFAFAFYHVIDRCAFIVREKGRIKALMLARCRPLAEMRKRDAAGEPLFQWERSQDNADGLHVEVAIGHKEQLGRLWRQVVQRWPDWKRKTVLAHRHGRLVVLPEAFIERVISNG